MTRIKLHGGPLHGRVMDVSDDLLRDGIVRIPVIDPRSGLVVERAPPPGVTFPKDTYRRADNRGNWEWCES